MKSVFQKRGCEDEFLQKTFSIEREISFRKRFP